MRDLLRRIEAGEATIICYAMDGDNQWDANVHIDVAMLLRMYLSALPIHDDAVTIYQAED